MEFFIISLVLLGFLCVVMVAAWAVQRATHNCGWVDMFWTYGTGVAGVAAALAPGVLSGGVTARGRIGGGAGGSVVASIGHLYPFAQP